MPPSASPMQDLAFERLQAAYQTARDELLQERNAAGHWIGELSTSALSTATAVSAMSVVLQQTDNRDAYDQQQLQSLVDRGIQWLATHQNADGGYGDTTLSYSNVATTMLVVAALHLAQVTSDHSELLTRANAYIDAQGRVQALRARYGKDKTFAVPILTNCAIAGLADWRDVAPLPFEAACLPQSWYRFVRLPVVSYAIPALVGIGQARYFHRKPRNPLMRALRAAAVKRSLRVLERMQPASGGYLEAVPLTSFVAMGLASTGRADHPVVRNGIRFIVDSTRPDGSWPIDTNLATWNTTLALNALATAGEDIAALTPSPLPWLLSCQHTERHPFTGADPGGFGWSDLSGAVPDADDTPGAILALKHWSRAPSCTSPDRESSTRAVQAAQTWLEDLQNGDGGWPTFCRGWTEQPFDRSGADLTAHALRAFVLYTEETPPSARLAKQLAKALQYLASQQRADGSWVPLWFGNQDDPNEENAIYGTAKVLVAWQAVARSWQPLQNDTAMSATWKQRIDTPHRQRAYQFLVTQQNADGGWGGGPACRNGEIFSSVEETALAVEALLPLLTSKEHQPVIEKGLKWLTECVERGQHRRESPIGFYFAKLWYHERLYPLTFTVSALGQAVRQLAHPSVETSPT